MAYSVTCPSCRSILKSNNPIPAGKKMKCPKCGIVFEAEPDDAVTAAPPKPAPPAAVAEPADDEEPRGREARSEEDDEPRKQKRREDDEEEDGTARKAKKKARMGMWIGLGVGGGFLLMLLCAGCGGLGFYFYSSSSARIVGTWESINTPIRIIYQFNPDGRGSMNALGLQVGFKYKLQGTTLEVEPERANVQGLPDVFIGNQAARRSTVTITGNEMVMTDSARPGVASVRFRRVQ